MNTKKRKKSLQNLKRCERGHLSNQTHLYLSMFHAVVTEYETPKHRTKGKLRKRSHCEAIDVEMVQALKCVYQTKRLLTLDEDCSDFFFSLFSAAAGQLPMWVQSMRSKLLYEIHNLIVRIGNRNCKMICFSMHETIDFSF